MKGQLLIIFAAITFSAAMVPKLRRAVNMDEDEEFLKSVSSTSEKSKEICMPQTPCAWSIYKSRQKIIDTQITNTYCHCGAGTTCQINEDDANVGAFIHRCRPPVDNDENTES
ncbi:unnamed protein product [Parnassius apollo]|uniref:(apollo) hypothetical protein n=1 Tax=Parnassius apollo TaxID=110799 RepID=A0A8S3WM86_PARAO|nr:unnamed protein product [Parnassius apollo]CAG4995090.1 unnamed protein product [Parnassius apollo]